MKKRRREFTFDIDEMTDEEAKAAWAGYWKRLLSTAQKLRHGTFSRSDETTAICEAGPGWHPDLTTKGTSQ